MNTEVKKLWTAALRSGEYEQGTGALRTARGYCCLGVLCEVAIKAGLKVEFTEQFDDDEVVFSYDDDVAYLPPAVCLWADLPDANPRIPLERTPCACGHEDCMSPDETTLANLNDGGASFAAIADAIDAYL